MKLGHPNKNIVVTPESISEYISMEPNNGCWLWVMGLDSRGYGRIWSKAKKNYISAHREIYRVFKESIPEGLEIDHKCRVRCCVNPDHLEAVTHQENLRRADVLGLGHPAKQRALTHCKRGHEFNAENTMHRKEGGRKCRACHYADIYSRRARKRAA